MDDTTQVKIPQNETIAAALLTLKNLRRVVATIKRSERWDLDRALYDCLPDELHTHLGVIMLRKVLEASIPRAASAKWRGWFWRDQDEWASECRLNARQQAAARRLLGAAGVEMMRQTMRDGLDGKPISASRPYWFRIDPVTFCRKFAAALGIDVARLHEELKRAATPITVIAGTILPGAVDSLSESTNPHKHDLRTITDRIYEPSPPREQSFRIESSVDESSGDASGSTATTTDEDQRIYNSAINQLELQLDKGAAAVLKEARLLRVDGGMFVIGVRNSYARDLCQHRLYRAIRRTFWDAAGRQDVELKFEVVDVPEHVPLFLASPAEPKADESGLRGTLDGWARAQLIDEGEARAAVDAMLRDFAEWEIEDAIRRIPGNMRKPGSRWFYLDKCLRQPVAVGVGR